MSNFFGVSMFFAGCIMLVLGPFLAFVAYREGLDGPTAFASGILVTCLGLGLVAGGGV